MTLLAKTWQWTTTAVSGTLIGASICLLAANIGAMYDLGQHLEKVELPLVFYSVACSCE